MCVISEDTIRGTFHQGDSSYFKDDTLGRQCMANAVAAAVYATMLPINYWNPPALDRILLAGDEFYRRRCNDQHQYLKFSDIRDTELLFGQQHDINANPPMTGLLQYKYAPSPPFFTLDQAVSSMENSHQWTYGILTIAHANDGSSVLLCVKQGNYYIFDSHSRDIFGNVVQKGTSVLLHMKTHNACMKYIKTIGCQLAASQFEITVISPAVSGFHRMLEPQPSSQKCQNKEKIQGKKSKTTRNTRNSTRQDSENKQNKEKNEKNTCKSTITTRNSTKKQKREISQTSQNEQDTTKSHRYSKKPNKEETQNAQRSENKERHQKVQNKTCQSTSEEENDEQQKYLHSVTHINYINDRSKNTKEAERNRYKKYNDNKKRKMVDKTNKELNTPTKRIKCQNIEKNSLSSTIDNRYNTRSKRTQQNPICEQNQSNSSQSNKRKHTKDKGNNLSKDKQKNSIDNNTNVTKRRRKNEKSQLILKIMLSMN